MLNTPKEKTKKTTIRPKGEEKTAKGGRKGGCRGTHAKVEKRKKKKNDDDDERRSNRKGTRKRRPGAARTPIATYFTSDEGSRHAATTTPEDENMTQHEYGCDYSKKSSEHAVDERSVESARESWTEDEVRYGRDAAEYRRYQHQRNKDDRRSCHRRR